MVDTAGKIVWIGHPASRNLEQDINDLLAGKTLDVKAGGDDDDEDEEEGKADGGVDTAKAKEAVDAFIRDTAAEKGWNDEAKKLMRAFLVLVS